VNPKLFLSSFAKGSGVAAGCFALTLVLAACGNAKTDTAAITPGGVRRACEARKTWQNPPPRECSNCMAKATTPKCTTCNVKDYSGVCADQEKARRDEPTCKDVNVCLFRCKDDCDCRDKCYADKATCEKLSGAVDLCTNQACDKSCR